MANQQFTRTPGKGIFGYLGINVAQPASQLPEGRARTLINVTVDLPRGTIQQRPGLTQISQPLGAAVHSLIRLNDPAFGSQPGPAAEVLPPNASGEDFVWVIGAGTSLYLLLPSAGAPTPTQIDTGYSGLPLALIPFRPEQSPRPWLYVFDAQRARKFLSGPTVAPVNVGLFPPQKPPITALAAPNLLPVADIVSTSGWAASGSASALSVVNRIAGGTTVAAILYDAGTSGWCSIQPSGTTGSSIVALSTPWITTWAMISGVATQQPLGTTSYSYIVVAFDGSGVQIGLPSAVGSTSQGPATITRNNYVGVGWNAVTGAASYWVYRVDGPGLHGRIAPSPQHTSAVTTVFFNDTGYVPDPTATIPAYSASTHNAAFGFGARLTVGSELTTVFQAFGGIPNTTVAGVMYDAGTSGMATVQAATPLPLIRNMFVTVNGTSARVDSITTGPDGLSSFRAVLPSGVAAGQAITVPFSIRCYTASTHAAGESITSQVLQANVAQGTDAVTSVISSSATLNLTRINSRPLTIDDYMHVSLRFDHPENIVEVHVLLDVDAQNNDFTGNYYYYVIQANAFQQIGMAGFTSETGALNAITNQIVDQYTNSTSAVIDQLPIGSSQFFEATFRLNEMVRVGTDPSATLAAVKAIGIRIISTGSVTIQFGSWWAAGTYGPDANWNSYGNQGQPILYRYRYRSSASGAFSNPSPATRSGELPVRNGVNIAVTASADAQADLIDIERNGGTFDTWHRFMIVPNASTTYLDSTNELVAMAGDPLETDAFPPFPVSDMVQTRTNCDIVGTRILVHDAAGVNVNWARGSQVIVNNQTYSLFSSPDSASTLSTNENIGVLTGATVIFPESTIMGVPLPAVCGPWDGRMWGCGDKFNPGLLYFGYSENPDAASDKGWIEVTTPSEPLLTAVIYEGVVFVFSTLNLYRVESTPGQVNPYAAYKLGSISSAPISRWAVAAGLALAWEGQDGIYLYSAAGTPENITEQDLAPLFRGGSQGT